MTDKIDDGGPAFPVVDEDGMASRGMNLRDWFAGQALKWATDSGWLLNEPQYVAERAYDMADAMLAARAKGGAQ